MLCSSMAGPARITALFGLLLVLLLLQLSGPAVLCLGLATRSAGLQQHRALSLARGNSHSYRSYPSSSSPSSSTSYRNRSPEKGVDTLSMDHELGRGNTHLTLYGIEVPVYKFRGEDAELKCRYDRGTDPLYSVKWYKDDREFYRYLFKMQSPKTTFSTPGVNVDVSVTFL
ncbi:uncharacterized protein [Cherax quadricarinatus]|uniref:uncharacterized protein n=1 Tax=Cherax quadricarinatus TaxID=27406 RepID=UPI00387E5C2B